MSHSFSIRSISADETRPLRSTVLRPGHPLAEAIYDGDDDPDTIHWGAFTSGHLRGVASLYREAAPAVVVQANDQVGMEQASALTRSWRLRGMAVDPDAQRQGYGKRLLQACLSHVAQQNGRLLWCNARSSAVAFYQSAGFQTQGAEFIIPDIGPHWVMIYFLEP